MNEDTRERLVRDLIFAWSRWGVAERRLTRTPRNRAAKAAAAFWRRAHNEAENLLARIDWHDRIDHAAVARDDADATFYRPPDAELPESFPDLSPNHQTAMVSR